jgi:hypothetical protein
MGNGSTGSDPYSPDYVTARRRFRDAAARLGWRLESFPVKAPHPAGQELAIDAAATPGGCDDGRAVVVSGGLHGVEGFLGSAVQVALLERWAAEGGSPRTPRLVFLHALNPYGFACLRRANEDNVDPNRNFLADGEAYGGSPKVYAAIERFLCPRRPPSRWEPFTLKALLAIARYGKPALKQAIAGGQYDFPRGLFYGGAAPSRTYRILREHLPRLLVGCDRVVHFDFHTGLGRWAACKLLVDYPLTDKQRATLTDWFGAGSFEAGDPNLTSYHAQGSFDHWCAELIPGCDYLHVCAEFGTYGPIRMLAGLRAENRAHHWGKPTDACTLRAKERIKELFCPASPDWRGRALATGVGLVETAVRRLAGSEAALSPL